MSDPKKLYASLSKSIQLLGTELLGGLSPTKSLNPGELVRLNSYIVLCHAALEEYFENLSLSAVDTICEEWRLHQRFRYGVACLLLHSGQLETIDDDSPSSVYERIKNALVLAKSRFSAGVKDNHGIGLRYLRKLFLPLGIDLPSDASLLASLESLSSNRGEIAHTAIGATRHRSPDDMKILVSDCLKCNVSRCPVLTPAAA